MKRDTRYITGLVRFGEILASAQRELFDLNELDYLRKTVRETQYSTKTGLIDFLTPKIQGIQQSVAQQISNI